MPKSKPCAGGRAAPVEDGGGSGLPSATTSMIRSTPALIPAANLPSRKYGAMVSAMMRRVVASVSVPSRP